MKAQRRRLYTRISTELYEEIRGIAVAGGYRSVHQLVTEILKQISSKAKAARRELCEPDVADEIDDMFAEFTDHQAPTYGLGKRQEGHREP